MNNESGIKGELEFNSRASTIMHIDLNSCFARIEQQANPHLRGKPIAVAAYMTPSGCILAPSVEAKKYGVRVGMRVKDGKLLCPGLIVLSPDPWKYRNVHLALRKIVSDYTADFVPKSIDEFSLNLEDYPALIASSMQEVARKIKERIKKEIGEWLTVSIGIAPNRFLAKTAAGLHKPDGLNEINKDNFLDIYSQLNLTDLCGIKMRSAVRLSTMGIHSVIDFYHAPIWKLRAAFSSILGYYWYLRLRGWEVDDVIFARRSYGNSFAFPARNASSIPASNASRSDAGWADAGGPKPLTVPSELSSILSKLVEKMGMRLRKAGYKAQGVHLAIFFRDHTFWHKGVKTSRVLFDSREIYKEIFKLLLSCPKRKPVSQLAVSSFDLLKLDSVQMDLFEDVEKKERLVTSLDKINERWGNFIICPARMLKTDELVADRIAFGSPRWSFGPSSLDEADEAGGVKELEEFTLQ
jgi:DNA polymerase-4